MLASYGLAIAIAAAPLQPVTPDRPISRHIEKTVFTADAPTTVLKVDNDKDSLKNGAIIGAVVGAAIAAVGLGAICQVSHEPGDPACWKDVLPWVIGGAGVGALGGAGVDAIFQRRFVVGASVKF